MKNKGQTINPTTWYSLQQIVKGRMLANLGGWESVRRLVRADKRNRNLLQAIITGTKQGQKYRIKGENIIKFKDVWEAGEYRLTYEDDYEEVNTKK